MTHRTLLTLVVLAHFAAPAAAQDPVTVGPTIYKTLLDNPHVRVLDVVFAKGAAIGLHHHPDHIAYVVKGGKLEITGPDGKATVIEAVAGQTFYMPAGEHSAKNVGKSELHVVVTELKDSDSGPATLTDFDRAELVAVLEQGRAELDALVTRATGDLWSKRPAEGRWSVAETVEHIAATEGMLFGAVTGALSQPASADWAPVAAGTSMSKLFGMLLDRSQKFQAPEPLQPHGQIERAELLGRYAGARAATLDFVRTTQAPLKAHLLDTPAGKMTAHQVIGFIAGHNMRHNAQIAETLAQLGAK